MNIGVTGGFGCGKSTVAKLLASRLQARYVNTDQMARDLLKPHGRGYQAFIALFGSKYLLDNGEIDRDRLRCEVFGDRVARKRLEEILHPLIAEDLGELMTRCRKEDVQFVAEVPLLFEVGWADNFDAIVTVVASSEIMVDRVIKRSGLKEKEIYTINKSQLDISEKRLRADYVIDNSGLLVSTVMQIGWLSGKIDGLKRTS